jgi:hypothetical protein
MAWAMLAVHGYAIFHIHADAIHAEGGCFFDLAPVVAGHVQ